MTATLPETESVWVLVERVQSGDTAAYAEIYRRYYGTVFRFVCFRVGNRRVAEDLTADAFERALRHIGSFTWQGRDLGAWLVTIARNLTADHFKSRSYRREWLSDLSVGYPMEWADDSPEGDPETTVEIRLAGRQILAAMACLTPEQRRCVSLRYLEEKSTAETARAMETTEGAVKALLYRALASLRRILAAGDVSAAVPQPRGGEVSV